jgi:hypothetical protein
VIVLIYQRDNDYGNDKAARRLICWKVAVGRVIGQINLAKELLRTRVKKRYIIHEVHEENDFHASAKFFLEKMTVKNGSLL